MPADLGQNKGMKHLSNSPAQAGSGLIKIWTLVALSLYLGSLSGIMVLHWNILNLQIMRIVRCSNTIAMGRGNRGVGISKKYDILSILTIDTLCLVKVIENSNTVSLALLGSIVKSISTL